MGLSSEPTYESFYANSKIDTETKTQGEDLMECSDGQEVSRSWGRGMEQTLGDTNLPPALIDTCCLPKQDNGSVASRDGKIVFALRIAKAATN